MGDTAKGQPSGLATLDASGDVPAGQIPATVALDSETMLKTLGDAQCFLGAVADDTPVAVLFAASTFAGRKASGDVCAMTAAEAFAVMFGADQTIPEGTDLAVGTTTGSKIGTGATQKLGLWGAAPVVQQAAEADIGALTSAQITGGESPTEAEYNQMQADVATVRTTVNSLLAKLRTIGVIAT